MLKQTVTFLALAGALAIQSPAQDKAPAAPAKAPTTAPKSPAAPPSQVDNVIQLLKGGMSEGLIIKTIEREKPVNLTTADMLKLQKAGVSENIINVMLDPGATPWATRFVAPKSCSCRASGTLARSSSVIFFDCAMRVVSNARMPSPMFTSLWNQ